MYSKRISQILVACICHSSAKTSKLFVAACCFYTNLRALSYQVLNWYHKNMILCVWEKLILNFVYSSCCVFPLCINEMHLEIYHKGISLCYVFAPIKCIQWNLTYIIRKTNVNKDIIREYFWLFSMIIVC